MTTKTLQLDPGEVLTGWGRRACDGALVEVDTRTLDGREELIRARIVELHDVGVADQRTPQDVALFLRRCLGQIEREGLTLIVAGEVHYLSPAWVSVQQAKLRQLCTAPERPGPFFVTPRPNFS